MKIFKHDFRIGVGSLEDEISWKVLRDTLLAAYNSRLRWHYNLVLTNCKAKIDLANLRDMLNKVPESVPAYATLEDPVCLHLSSPILQRP